MADVLMPKLSDTMEEGKILRWLKRLGERVEEGDLLVEVETDKADMEVEATAAGVLREVLLDEGQSGRVGQVIAVIDDGGSEAHGPAAKPSREGRARDGSEGSAKPAERATDEGDVVRADAGGSEEEAEEEGGEAETTAPLPPGEERGEPPPEATGVEPQATKPGRAAPRAVEPPRAATGTAPVAPKGKARVSPLARSLAAELGVDPDAVRGTGPGGRVVRRDIEAAARAGEPVAREARAAERPAREPRPAEPAARTPPPPVAVARPKAGHATGTPVARPAARAPAATRSGAASPEGIRSVPLSPMRASIARRMTESKREAPHFYLSAVVDMDPARALREAMRTSETVASIVTFNHMIVKAAADALRAFPELNARFAGDAVEILDGIHVGIATAVPEGLIVPVIHDADRKTLVEIATAARALAEKARARNFSGDELMGATFTVSNLGMYEVDSFTAVINPPQAAILAVGAVAERPFVRGGALVAAHTLNLTLSCDHRAVDGARGAEFLRDLKARLENPARLLFPAAATDA